MSNPIKDIRSLLRITNAEVDRAEELSNAHETQVTYLSEKMEKMFHNLREFNMLHGRDLHPEVLDAFNASWRSHEASFDVWKAHNKNIPFLQYNNLTDDI
jgi:hypothetical protein